MLKKITLKNYMSHALTVIEPAAGLTVLIGPNNCGKSAVVSALQTLCGNERGPYMVRHNEKECRVTVETDDGHTIEWFRSKGTPGYVLDGVPVHRVKKDILDQIQEVLRLPKVTPSDAQDAVEFEIHFAAQKSPIFLLNEAPSRAAMFFASASDAALLVDMQKKHRAKSQKAAAEKLDLEEKLRETDALLAALDPVAELNTAMREAEREYEALREAAAATAALQHFLAQLAGASASRARCEAELESIRTLTSPPSLIDTTPLTALIERIEFTQRSCSHFADLAAAAGTIVAPPLLSNDDALASLCSQLSEQERAQTVNAAREASLAALHAPPVPRDVSRLARIAEDLDAARCRVDAHTREHEALQALAALPVPVNTDAMSGLLSLWQKYADDVAAAASDVEKWSAEAEAVAERIRAWAERNPTCPTCGSDINAESILQRGGHDHAS